jgi:hypothetical protein
MTTRTIALILMVSRLCLAAEYTSIVWHVRKFTKSRLAFLAQILVHLAAAMIYLGISFRFEYRHSQVFIVWYIVCAMETVLSFGLGLCFNVLGLEKTHLMNRMSLLTIMILGDGIVVLAEKVVTIVKSADAWSRCLRMSSRCMAAKQGADKKHVDPIITGTVTAGSATTYFVFLVYFDWMKSRHLPPLRQMIWSLLHFPLHLAMVLFMQGFTQFVLWAKVIDVLNSLRDDWITSHVDAFSRATSAVVQANLSAAISRFFDEFSLKYDTGVDTVQAALENITVVPDEFWPQLAKFINTLDDADHPALNTTDYFFNILEILISSVENSIFSTYDIDLTQEHLDRDQGANAADDIQDGDFEFRINTESWRRYRLVVSCQHRSYSIYPGMYGAVHMSVGSKRRSVLLRLPCLGGMSRPDDAPHHRLTPDTMEAMADCSNNHQRPAGCWRRPCFSACTEPRLVGGLPQHALASAHHLSRVADCAALDAYAFRSAAVLQAEHHISSAPGYQSRW